MKLVESCQRQQLQLALQASGPYGREASTQNQRGKGISPSLGNKLYGASQGKCTRSKVGWTASSGQHGRVEGPSHNSLAARRVVPDDGVSAPPSQRLARMLVIA